ncbi:serine/threonine-protein kinase [Euzebya rosea]|uniref:serine/threonine-protein kinase n=1 Tax=Euzebya rosea TaxID=2052804 RepID=UPI000D3E7771|nr:serine/threonine-protein kinase [Euzebya rosea]
MDEPAFAVPGFQLQQQLGRGGFGVVYLATATRSGQPLALKVLHRVLDEDAVHRVAAEVQVMGTLAWHPAIVAIIDAGDVDGQPWIAMEYLARGSLGDLMRREGAQPVDMVTAAGIQAATGLQVAHNAGLLHRDVKPDNLLIADDGQVKVSDFGVALAAGAAGRRRGTTGTIAYSAPELLAGAGASTATDIYALGATLYALLTGQPAFHRDTDESPAAMMLRAHRDPVPDLAEQGFPLPVARVLRRAMAKAPTDRPARAEDLARELQSARQELGLAAVPVVTAGRPASPSASGLPAPAAGLPDQPPAEARRKAQRLQRIVGGIGAAAAALVAVTFVATSSFTGGGDPDVGSDAAPDVLPTQLGEAPDAAEELPDLPQTGPQPGDPEDDPGQDAAEAPPVTATLEPAPAPTVAPGPPAPAPPPPPLPTTGDPAAVAAVTFEGTATALASDGDVIWVSTATEVVRLADGGRIATPVPDISGLAVSGDLLAVRLPNGVQVLDATTLRPVGDVVPGAVDVSPATGGFLLADRQGLARWVDGTVERVVDLPGATQVDSAGDTIVAATTDGTVVSVRDGIVDQLEQVSGTPVELVTAGPDRVAVLTGDGRLHDLVPGGAVVTTGATDVAGTTDGRLWAVVDGRLQLIRLDGATAAVDTVGDVTRLATTGAGVVVAEPDAALVELIQ